MMKSRPLLWCAAAAAALCSAGALANVVVVKSFGPSARAYPPGKTLPVATKLKLQGGDVVTILGPGTKQTLRGPGNFDTTQVSLDTAASQRGRFAALRNTKVPHSPTVWDIDVTQSGKICVANARQLQLWRPQSDEAESLEIRSADGRTEKLNWVSGKALAAWPASLPIKSGERYEIVSSQRTDKSSVEVAVLSSAPLERVATAQALIQNGCENQLDLLLANTDKADEGK